MGGPGAANLVSEDLSPEEVTRVLKRCGFGREPWIEDEHVGGQGGFSTVVGIAVFASLGGMLFGLDIGYIAGIKAMRSFQNDLLMGARISAEQDSVITTVFGLGAAITAFPPIIGFLVDKLGRKGSVVAGGIVFCIGAFIQGAVSNMGLLMSGRLIAGMSVGLLSANVPVYQSEIAPPSHRGMLVSVYQLAITVGIMLSFVFALLMEDVTEPISGWRWVILIQLIPGLALAGAGFVMGESPRWLMQKRRHMEAYEVLEAVRAPEDNVKMELAQICREMEKDHASEQPSWGEFFSGDLLKLLGIGVALQLLQQICGLNVFMYDGPKIFNKVYHSDTADFIFQSVSGLVNILSTFPAILLVDKLGRCVLLKWSALGMAACSAVLASVGMWCMPGHSENQCGVWSKATVTGAIFVFIFNFGYGWGPVVWTYCAEMFPTKYRSKATGLTTQANWIGNMFVAFVPPLLLDRLSFGTFWIFFAVNLLGFALASKLPETKDQSLEEIQEMYTHWFHGGAKLGETESLSDGAES